MANTTTHKAQDTANKTADQAKGAVSSGAEKAKDVAHSAVDRTKEAAQAGVDKARDLANTGFEKAKDAAQSAGHLATHATESVGSGMESLAGTIRDSAPGGTLGNAASSVADTLERGGRYIREEGLSGMADELTGTIRRNPIPSVLVAVAVGFLLARATRS